MKRWISMLLAIILVLWMSPIPAHAQHPMYTPDDLGEIIASGTCGADGGNVTWTLYDTGLLVISGSGAMKDYDYYAPWSDYDSQIKEAVIEEGVTAIGDNAFFGCDGLITVTIPASVTDIGMGAFASCDNLMEISVDEDNPNYSSDARGVLFNKNQTLLIQAPGAISGSYAIPDGVTAIGYEAFNCCSSLTDVTIPVSVTVIGEAAFYVCSSLTDVYYTGTEELWEQISIDICNEALTGAAIHFGNATPAPDSNEILGAGECGADGGNVTWTLYKSGLLKFCGSGAMQDYTLIGYFTTSAPWYGYRALITQIAFEDGIASIGDYAFYTCLMATAVNIPESVTSIGNASFAGCESLPEVTLPDSITTIGSEAFSSCGGLTGMTIPESVTTMGDRVFSDCDGLITMTIPCSISSIGYQTFYTCNNLTSVTISDGVSSIGSDAFCFCTSLTDVVIPDSVTEIGAGAFSYTALTNVTIPEGVTAIRDSTFTGCADLTEVTIPGSVTEIGDYAFDDCDSLTDVYYGGTEEQWQQIIFGHHNECLLEANIHFSSNGPAGTLYGDASGDGKINTLDLILLRKFLNGGDTEVDEEAIDCSGDGKVNTLDLILLRKFLNGDDITLGPQET